MNNENIKEQRVKVCQTIISLGDLDKMQIIVDYLDVLHLEIDRLNRENQQVNISTEDNKKLDQFQQIEKLANESDGFGALEYEIKQILTQD